MHISLSSLIVKNSLKQSIFSDTSQSPHSHLIVILFLRGSYLYMGNPLRYSFAVISRKL